MHNKVEKYNEIGRVKNATSIKKLCETLPVFSGTMNNIQMFLLAISNMYDHSVSQIHQIMSTAASYSRQLMRK